MLMMRNRCSTSSSVREEVGSSKTMTLELYETALAISTICRCETGSVLMIRRGSTSISSSLKTRIVSSYILRSSTMTPPIIG